MNLKYTDGRQQQENVRIALGPLIHVLRLIYDTLRQDKEGEGRKV